MTGAPTVLVYSRPGCHLCADALRVLGPLAVELGFTLTEIDITTDDALHLRYLERIPVMVLDGEEISDFFVDEADLRSRIARIDAA